MIHKKVKKGPIVKLRKVMKSGSSLYICLPKDFIELHGIHKKAETVGLLKECLLLYLRGAITKKQSKKVRNSEANAEIASRLCLSQ